MKTNILQLNNVRVVFIMFGDACNLQCKYCMQHELIESPTAIHTQTINKDIYKFIEGLVNDSKDMVDIRFYGGEPLLFFDQIKEVVKEIRSMELPVMFSIITNGKLLTLDIVNYFNDNGVSVAISWDGDNVEKTRGYNALVDKKDIIMKLNNLCIDGVMTPYSYLMDFMKQAYAFVAEYNKTNESFTYINYDTLMKFMSTNKEIGDIDLDEVSKQSYAVANAVYDVLTNEKEPTELERYYGDCFKACVAAIASFDENADNTFTRCGNGVSVINVNLKGELYLCHNTNSPFSTIYDSKESYMEKLRVEDKTIENVKSDECKNCEAFPICRGGCPLVTKADRSIEKSYCDIQRAFYIPFIKTAQMIITKEKDEIR